MATNRFSKRLAWPAAAVLALSAGAVPTAIAQEGTPAQAPSGVQAGGLGGVRAAAPQAQQGTPAQAPAGVQAGGLGGVRSAGPRPLTRTGTLLPPPPAPTVRTPVTAPQTGFVRRPATGAVIRRPIGVQPVVTTDQFGRVLVDGTTFGVSGSVGSPADRLRVQFRAGGPVFFHSPQHGAQVIHGPFVDPWLGTHFHAAPHIVAGHPVHSLPMRYAAQPVVYTEMAPPPQVQQVAEPIVLTPVEYASLLIRDNQADEAVRALRQYLRDNPEDTDAMLVLGASLLEARQIPEAVAVNALAYDTDPSLAHRPLRAEILWRTGDSRRALNRAVIYANRVNTASAWLLVTTIMQAEGRTQVAGRMLDRAVEQGLSERVSGEFAAALRR